MDLQVGSVVGDYQVVGILGAGGMGSVYQVKNLISDRVEAMKVLLPDLTTNQELAERFQREIKVLGSLDHPNIAQLRTAFRADNQLLMIMEFVDGSTLEHLLKNGPLPVGAAIEVISQVLSALDFAHSHGVIHRDIKPANIILTKGGMAKLMDFGIAKAATDHKLTMTGTTMGSLYYMSPEQIQGAATLDARADLYSMGVTLYQVVTGKRPFDGDSQYAIMAAHLQNAPVPPVEIDPRLPQALNDVILMSVAKDPGARFQTAAAFRNALAGVAASIKGPTEPAFAPAPGTAGPTAPSYVPPPAQPSPIQAPPPGMFSQPAPQPMPTQPSTPVPPAFAAPPPPAFAAPPPPPPGYTPMAGAAPQPLRPQAAAATGKSKRGLWMAVGGLAAAAAVICAIQFGPWKHAAADSTKQQATVTQPLQKPDTPSTQTPATTAADTIPQNPPEVVTAPSSGAPGGAPVNTVGKTPSRPATGVTSAANQQHAMATQPGNVQQPLSQPQQTQQPPPQQPQVQQPSVQPPQNTAAQPAAPAGPSREEIMHARDHVAKLHVRANTIRDSLANFKRSQQAQGVGTSGKFTQPEGLMNTYLQGANEALNDGDLKAFRDYAAKAERQIEILEKLLNL